jgi:hypothetical protein
MSHINPAQTIPAQTIPAQTIPVQTHGRRSGIRLIGDEQITEESRSRNQDGRTSITESTRHRLLAPTADLRPADTGTGVLVYGNFHPARLKLRRPSTLRRPKAERTVPVTCPGVETTRVVRPLPRRLPEGVEMEDV